MNPIIVDISHHNVIATDGFNKLARAGYKGIINKATEGNGMVDVTYAARRRDCVDAGLEWGAYHFARRGDGVAQADRFLSIAKPDASTLLALDWESARGDKSDTFTIEQAKAFLDRVCTKTGRTPDQVYIYGGNVLKELITSEADKAYFGKYRLWLCQYGPEAKLPSAWPHYDIWQFTEHGSATGVGGLTDNNVAREGFDFGRDWGAEGTKALAPSTNVVSLAMSSRTVRAGGVGLAGIFGILQNWWNELIHYAIPPADGIQGLVDQTQSSVDTTKQVAALANINIEHLMLWIVLAIVGYMMIRRVLDKREQAL